MTDPKRALREILTDWKAWGVDAVTRSREDAVAPLREDAVTGSRGHAVTQAREHAVTGGGSDAPDRATGCSDLNSLRAMVAGCTACRLHSTRTQTVFCSGNPSPLMFVGEAPGADEDARGEVFVGRAGQLLTKIMKEAGIARDKVYVANVLKCRPPDNRPPEPDEAARCAPFLARQIALVNPKVICALGKHAARSLLGWEGAMGKVRGTWRQIDGRWATATYHPSYLLRSPGDSVVVREDLRAILERLRGLGAAL